MLYFTQGGRLHPQYEMDHNRSLKKLLDLQPYILPHLLHSNGLHNTSYVHRNSRYCIWHYIKGEMMIHYQKEVS